MAFLRKQNKIFHICYYDKTTGKLKSFTTRQSSHAAANAILKQWNAAHVLNLLPLQTAGKILFSRILELFLFEKEINNLSAKTVTAYKTAKKIFIKHCGDKYITDYTAGDFKFFIDALKKESYSPNSIANYTRHLYAIANFALKNNYLNKNIFLKFQPVPNRVIIIAPGHLKELLNSFIERKMISHYNFVKLTYLCAFRKSEAVQVQSQDFDHSSKLIYIRNSKGKRTDVIPMLKDIEEHLSSIELPVEGKLFKFAGADSIKTFWNTAISKLGHHYTFHQLRKTRGSELANMGVEPLFLQKFMRHKDIKTTLTYYIKIENDKMRESINSRIP